MPSCTIGLNDFRRQWQVTRSDVHAAVERVGMSGWYVLGDEVARFEEELAAVCHVEHVIGCASGLDALELALRASGLRSGDAVITTPLSAFATTLAIARAGGRPVFADVDENGLLDLHLVEEALNDRDDVRFVLPVHLYGCPYDLQQLAALAENYDVTCIEDCAQAVGASDRGTAVGTVGRAAGVSFYPTKNLGCMGDGGAVLTRDPGVEQSVRSMRDYGQTSKYEHDVLGLNSRLDEMQAAIMRTAMLPRLAEWTARRRQIASSYLAAFHDAPFRTLSLPEGREPVWHLFPILLPDALGRDSLANHLASRGIRTGVHYPFIIPDQRALAAIESCHALTPLPKAARFAATALSLPIHPFLTDTEVCMVIDACRDWVASYRLTSPSPTQAPPSSPSRH